MLRAIFTGFLILVVGAVVVAYLGVVSPGSLGGFSIPDLLGSLKDGIATPLPNHNVKGPLAPEIDSTPTETPKVATPETTAAPQPTPEITKTPEVKPCAVDLGGGGRAPDVVSLQGVEGTTTGDIRSFSAEYNKIRVANCLQPISPENFIYDSCMEKRLFFLSENPTIDPTRAWGPMGVPSDSTQTLVGCDGNLIVGVGETGATAAQNFWNSEKLRDSLYVKIDGNSKSCVYFAAAHGNVGDVSPTVARIAARWGDC